MSDFDMAIDEHDWMEDQDDQTPGTSAQPVAVSKFHLHEPVTGPKQDEAEKIREQKKASAWSDWASPPVADGEPPSKTRRLSGAEKSAVEKHSAAALALAKKAAHEKESACRLASKVASQKEDSAARQILRRAGKSDGEIPKLQVESKTTPAVSDPPVEQEKPTSSTPDIPKPKRAARNTAGTFAGYRPPADPALNEIFMLKKELYGKTREELAKMYPGRKMEFGKTCSQAEFWNYIRKKMTELPKIPKPTQADVRAAVKKASAEWKQKISAEMGTSGKSGGS